MLVTDLLQCGNYLVVNPRKLFKIFPKYVPEASSGPDFHVFHMSGADDPNRQGIHRLLIAKRDCEDSRDPQGRYSPQPTYGVKLLHVKYNNRRGLDFHVFSPSGAMENFSIPLRSLHIMHGTNPNFQDSTLNSLSGLSGMKAWRILGYDQEENPIQIAQFSVTSALAGYANTIDYVEI